MGEPGKFGVAEAVVLLTMSVMARIFLAFPRSLLEVAGPAAWISVLAGLVFSLLQVCLFVLILRPHPQKNIVDITGEALGKAAGSAVNVVYVAYFILVAAVYLRPFSEALLLSALPRTPISVISITFLSACMVGAYVGVEAMARAARITYPFVLGGVGLLLLGVSPQWESSNLFPLLGTGPVNVFITGGFLSGQISEIFLAAVIVQSIHGPALFGKIVSRAMVMGFLLLAMLEVVAVLTVTYHSAVEYTIPFYDISRLIYLSRFFQRVESIFIIIWVFIGMVKVALSLYAASAVLARTLRLPDNRPLLWSLAMIVLVTSLLPPDLPSIFSLEREWLRRYTWIPTIALPGLVLAASRFRKGGQTHEGG